MRNRSQGLHIPQPWLVPCKRLPHNGLRGASDMKRSFLVTIAVLTALSGLGIGILAERVGHMRTARAASLARGSDGSDPNNAGGPKVIRFASNPQPAPPFLGRDLDGNIVSTAEWPGKVVFVNFWATWCPPCREEIPILIELQKRYKDGLQVIGVSLDDGSPEDVKQFAKLAGINYPVVMYIRELVAAYGGVPALPTSFLLNKEAKIVQKHQGLYPPELYETEIRALLGLPIEARVETFEDIGQIFLKNAARATELPDVDFAGLTPEQKAAALKRLNTDICDCGCHLTLAQCRINDTLCPVSKSLAAKVVKDIQAGGKAAPDAVPAPGPNPALPAPPAPPVTNQ